MKGHTKLGDIINQTPLKRVARKAYWTVRSQKLTETRVLTHQESKAEFKIGSLSEDSQQRFTFDAEKPVLDEVLGEVERDDIFYDIGANVGMFTCLIGPQVSSTHAFEPEPRNFRRLEEHVAHNKVSATCQQVALADYIGEAQLEISTDEVGAQQHKLGDGEGESITVDVSTASDYAQKFVKPDVLKIDVEGAGMSVLSGLDELIDDVRAIFIETHDNADRIKPFLKSNGFRVTEIEQQGSRQNGADPFFKAVR